MNYSPYSGRNIKFGRACAKAYSSEESTTMTQSIFSMDDQLIFLIDRLNSAVNVCHEAPDIDDQGYPYATGYSQSAMSDVADSLSAIVAQMREEEDG